MSGAPPETVKSPEDLKMRVDLVRYEIEHRRKKQWDIFAWSVTIFISVIAGALALISKGDVQVSDISRKVMSFAVGMLVAYAVIWLQINICAEARAIRKLSELLPGDPLPKPSDFPIGYVFVAFAIGVTATGTVLFAQMIPIVKVAGH